MASNLIVNALRLFVKSTGSRPVYDEQDATLIDDQGATLVYDSDAVLFTRRPSITMSVAVTAYPVEFTVERRRVYITFGPLLRPPGRLFPGSTILVTGTFRDEDGLLFDPMEVELLVSAPFSRRHRSYQYAESEIRRISDGKYEFDLTLDEPGRWFVQWRVVAKDVTSIKEMQIVVADTPHYQYPREAYAD